MTTERDEERDFEEAIRAIGAPPNMRQVGWMDGDRFHREWWSPDDVPVYVKVPDPEPERCHECGSVAPTHEMTCGAWAMDGR